MATKLGKLQIIGIKTESSQNSAATLASTDYVLAQASEPKPIPEFIPRECAHQSLDQLAHVIGKVYAEVKITVEQKGSGAPGTAHAPLDALKQAAGLTSTIVSSTSVTNAPTSIASAGFFGPGKSCTVVVYKAGGGNSYLKYVMTGCIAKDAKLVLKAGSIAIWEFTLHGLYTAVTDSAAPTTSYSVVNPATLVSASFSLHSYAATIGKFEIDFGNEVALREDVNSSFGVKGFVITGRNPKGSFDPEIEAVATHDFIGRLLSGAESSGTITLGSNAGNILTTTMPKVQYAGFEHGDRNGIAIGNIPLRFNQSSGDDWVSFVET